MKTEIEVKFLNVDFLVLRKRLEELGAHCEMPMRAMRRSIIETEELRAKNAFVRVRDEGDKITLTYKQFDEDSLTGAKEIETVVSDFDTTVSLLAAAGLPQKSFQESRRETWRLDMVEVVLDEWPWLNPYIEIEGSSEEGVMKVAEQLGFDWDQAVFGKVTSAYQAQYPKGNADKLVTIPTVAFDAPVPEVISGVSV
jgi:adenylate cyclase class 2